MARSGDIKVIATCEGRQVGICFCVKGCDSSMCHLARSEEHAEAIYDIAKTLFRMLGFEVTDADACL